MVHWSRLLQQQLLRLELLLLLPLPLPLPLLVPLLQRLNSLLLPK
jgi:hypothetical protein